MRDPLAAGPEDDLRLGDTVGDPAPSPTPTATASAPTPAGAAPDASRAGGYEHSLIYSGVLGLVLAVTGLTMVGLRRRRW